MYKQKNKNSYTWKTKILTLDKGLFFNIYFSLLAGSVLGD